MNRLPPGKQQPQQAQRPPQTHGPVESMPCPHCGKRNDHRNLASQQLLDTGHKLECDHCHQFYVITAMRQITLLSVAPVIGQRFRQLPHQRPAAQATTISQAQARKLIHGK